MIKHNFSFVNTNFIHSPKYSNIPSKHLIKIVLCYYAWWWSHKILKQICIYRLVRRLLTQRPTRRDRLIKINKIKLNHCWPKRLCERILCCTRQPATNLWPIFFITWPVCRVCALGELLNIECLCCAAGWCTHEIPFRRTKFGSSVYNKQNGPQIKVHFTTSLFLACAQARLMRPQNWNMHALNSDPKIHLLMKRGADFVRLVGWLTAFVI